MLKGAGFDRDKERLKRIAKKAMESDKSLQLVMSILSASVPSSGPLLYPAVSDSFLKQCLNVILRDLQLPAIVRPDINQVNDFVYPRLSGSSVRRPAS